jgi:hypothetical protein
LFANKSESSTEKGGGYIDNLMKSFSTKEESQSESESDDTLKKVPHKLLFDVLIIPTTDLSTKLGY